MGGRRASSGKTVSGSSSFINDIVKNYDDFTRSDLQAVVQARVMQTGEDEDKLLDQIDKEHQRRLGKKQ